MSKHKTFATLKAVPLVTVKVKSGKAAKLGCPMFGMTIKKGTMQVYTIKTFNGFPTAIMKKNTNKNSAINLGGYIGIPPIKPAP